MNPRRLWWITIAAPTVAVAVFDYVRYEVFVNQLHQWPGTVLFLVLVFLGSFAVTHIVFGYFETRKRSLVERAQDLPSLQSMLLSAGEGASIEAACSSVLDKVVHLTEADSGAIYLRDQTSDSLRLAGSHNWPGNSGSQDSSSALDSLLSGARSPDEVRVWDSKGLRAMFGNMPTGVSFRSLISVPLYSRGQVLGILALAKRKKAGDWTYDIDFLRLLGRDIGSVVDNLSLFSVVQRREQEAEALERVATQVLALLDLNAVLKTVVDEARTLLRADAACLHLLSNGHGDIATNMSSGDARLCRCDMQSSTRGGDLQQSASTNNPGKPLSLKAPLMGQGTIKGELCVARKAGQPFTGAETQLLTRLARQTAIAVDNARMHHDIQAVATLQERERIAREIHDSLAQVLGLLKMKARLSKDLLYQGETQQVAQELDEMREIAHEAYADAREAILGLRDSVSPSLGLLDSLREYVQKFSRQSGVHVELEIEEGLRPTFTPAIEVQLIRVTQEALSNVRKHAHARSAVVSFRKEDSRLKMVVEDDGQGFDANIIDNRRNGEHYGTKTMAERMRGVGGELVIDSEPGKGTRVIVTLPEDDIGGTHGNNSRAGG